MAIFRSVIRNAPAVIITGTCIVLLSIIPSQGSNSILECLEFYAYSDKFSGKENVDQSTQLKPRPVRIPDTAQKGQNYTQTMDQMTYIRGKTST